MSEKQNPKIAQLSRDSASRAVPFLDLAREYRIIAPALQKAVEEVFSSQHFVLGKQVSAFEHAAREMCGVPHAIGCASGTDALWLALEGVGVQPGDAVVTTAFSFFATASAILRCGAKPVLADIDPETFNLDPSSVNALLSKRSVRAILPVHLYGQVTAWDAFTNLQQQYGVLLIEDAAQAFGASWNGKKAGSLGDAAAFSFYPTKNLSAAGDAGMVTTVDDAIAERAQLLHVHGMRKRYEHEIVGWNSRLDTLQAAVLLVKLGFIDAWNEQRRVLARNYDALFAQAALAESGPYPRKGVVLPKTQQKSVHIFHQYVIRVDRRDALRAFLKDRGIGSEVYYPLALHQQPALQALGYTTGDFPESERAAAEVLALPIFPQLEFEEQQLVVAAIGDFLG